MSLPDHLLPSPPGRHRLPREVVEEHQRDRVLEAATGVFAKRGYQGTTVGHIAAAAEVGVGTFYSLFQSKEDCFLAAYDRAVTDARTLLEEEVSSEEPWPHRVFAALRVLLRRIEERPLTARIALVEVQAAGSEALARHQRNIELAAQLLRSGREYSEVPTELPSTMEYATVGGLAWFLQQRIAAGETANATDLLPEVLEIVLEPYLGEEATARLALMELTADS